MTRFSVAPDFSGTKTRAVLAAIDEMSGAPGLESLAEYVGTSPSGLSWYLQQLELHNLVDFQGPEDHRVMMISPDGVRALIEGHDLWT